MRQNEVKLLYSYLYNNQLRYENDVHQLQRNIRYRRIDVVDCMELACALERLNTFAEVSKDIRTLLHIKGEENEL